ncbi:hypothetical protein ACFQ0B_31400 [Nonomuraea thailandensis]
MVDDEPLTKRAHAEALRRRGGRPATRAREGWAATARILSP